MEIATLPNQMDPEFQLTVKFAQLTRRKKELALETTKVNEELDETEDTLMRMLEDQDKKATARFSGLGHVTCVDPAPYASIEDGREQILFESLRLMGREDLIKTSVNTRSLTTLVREQLKKNEPVPDGCTYYMAKRLQFYPEK